MNFKYFILSSRMPHSDNYLHLYNEIYDLWEDIFDPVLNGQAHADSILDTDLCTGIVSDGKVIGCHFYRFLNLKTTSVRQCSYFKDLSDSSWSFLTENNFTKLMSLEFLLVHPDFRKSKVGFSLSETLISLGLKIMQSTSYHAGIGTARTVVKVDQSTHKVGFITVQEKIDKFGNNCSFMVCPANNVKKNPDFQVQRTVQLLWENRIDETQLTFAKPDFSQEISA